ncbi:MAG TPA: DUF1573 domain-containing protein [Chitinophagaceae bacterium]|nr:DUF1573 domain-containing protein [Chitinophagaceae bacterium]MCB9056288.1 DUF1573 domain-containing protein [Chitinophagales bacterium]HPG11434.1 DUF1573 domain-containing protein [Chitinophagaceae bacterium]
MKKITFILALFSLSLSIQAQDTDKKEDALFLKETEYNFGKIPQGKPVYHSFELVNKGDTELKLDNVQASCGCTTPEWNREPIPAGGSTIIKVGYNAAAVAPFDKYITIYYHNSTQTKQIRIKGEVWKAPDGPAPGNASINFLRKQIQ